MGRMIQLPEAFVTDMRRLLGNEAEAFFSTYDQPPVRSLRLNPALFSAEEESLPFARETVPWCRFGRYVTPSTRPGASIAHFAGAFYLQESAAMAPVMVLAPQPGETVADLCAAPGGKSTEILSCLMGEGALLANEIDGKRARILSSNVERMGAWNCAVTSESPARLAQSLPEAFDAVLVDAPCSGEGMFRREPDSLSQWTESSPAGCAKRQAEVLDEAAKLVRPGGRMVYSTCTFNDLEDEGTVDAFLSRHPEFCLEPFDREGLSSKTGIHRLWPHTSRSEGHFMALLRKSGSSAEKKYAAAREKSTYLDFLRDEVGLSIPFPTMTRGDRLFSSPPLPSLSGLRVVSPGACLVETVGKTLRPAHALSRLALPIPRRAALSDEEAASYLAGAEIAREGDPGWTLATWHDLPLGWGKQTGSSLKNHLPKGLRTVLHP